MSPASDHGVLARLAREPLVHFLLLAGLLFLAQAIFAGDRREVIVVDAAAQQYLFRQQEELLLRPLTAAEKQAIVDNFIEEEILVREATARGFTDSGRIRALLLQNMRFLIAGDLPEPSETELRAFYEKNKDDLASPPSVDLDHILYESPDAVPPDLVTQLNEGADPARFGTPDFATSLKLRFMDTGRLVNAFGPEAAREITALPPDDRQWHGPFVSPQGTVHFIRVAQRNEPRIPTFDRARDWIIAQWFSAKSRELMDRELETLRPNYRVEVTPLDETQGEG